MAEAVLMAEWPERYPIILKVSTDEPAHQQEIVAKLLWAHSGGVFWLIGEPPEPTAICCAGDGALLGGGAAVVVDGGHSW